ncbi:unnamed protein product [Soboliphyme baturini]|uniref:Ovule protein n=1 Tax=Soboliphyme baturini TaxID=241478 RepID=A0A183IAF1_9BILA|nr:unnamed protein product [Soboliphyme baturini]
MYVRLDRLNCHDCEKNHVRILRRTLKLCTEVLKYSLGAKLIPSFTDVPFFSSHNFGFKHVPPHLGVGASTCNRRIMHKSPFFDLSSLRSTWASFDGCLPLAYSCQIDVPLI